MPDIRRPENGVLVKLTGHENLCRLELWPEVARDDRWVHHRLCNVSI